MPQFGIGLHHGGLNVRDKSLVEELFSNNKIQRFIEAGHELIIDACKVEMHKA